MTRLEDVSTTGIRGSESSRATTREAGARSVIEAGAPLANEVTGATARTIVNLIKRRNSRDPQRAGCLVTVSEEDDSGDGFMVGGEVEDDEVEHEE